MKNINDLESSAVLLAPFRLLSDKQKLIKHIECNKEHLDDFILFAGQANGWRACWALTGYLSKGDHYLNVRIDYLLDEVFDKPDGHQREILKLLLLANFNETQSGKIFDIATKFWINPKKIPSLRMVAWEHLYQICSSYNDLWNDLVLLTQGEYLDSLSPGIQNSIHRPITKLKKTLHQKKIN